MPEDRAHGSRTQEPKRVLGKRHVARIPQGEDGMVKRYIHCLGGSVLGVHSSIGGVSANSGASMLCDRISKSSTRRLVSLHQETTSSTVISSTVRRSMRRAAAAVLAPSEKPPPAATATATSPMSSRLPANLVDPADVVRARPVSALEHHKHCCAAHRRANCDVHLSLDSALPTDEELRRFNFRLAAGCRRLQARNQFFQGAALS